MAAPRPASDEAPPANICEAIRNDPEHSADPNVTAGELSIAYVDAGDPTAEPVVLLHGYPYDIHSYVEVIPLLVDSGFRVLVPYCAGMAPRDSSTIPLPDQVSRLHSARTFSRSSTLSTFRAHPGGLRLGRTRRVRGRRALARTDIRARLGERLPHSEHRRITHPDPADLEAGFWYFWYFATDRGRAGLEANRRDIAKVIWTRNSPEWAYGDADLGQAAVAFENPDYVDIVIHSYRHRLGLASGAPHLEDIERRLADQPPISVPTITLDGLADGNFPATDGSQHARLFTGPREHRQIAHAGHNLPAEQPRAFADAILAVAAPPSNGAGTP